jgi:phenylacetate-CoA ligase
MSYPTYLETLDVRALLEDYPLDERFLQRHRTLSRDALFARQDAAFRRCLARAWRIPFYQRLWRAAGIEPGDVRGLADITRLPMYSKSDIMASVNAHPPFGDFHGRELDDPPLPMVFHTTSGTTGRPQPLFFSPRSREVQSMLLARIYRLNGVGAHDVVHSVYGHGMINGGHYVREAVTHYTNALFCSAGTGVETRSAQQVALMKDLGATVIVGFADYIKKLAEVARDQGLVPGRDIPIKRVIGHLGRESREQLSEAWGGVALADWYGVGDTGAIAGELGGDPGMYLMEDAQYVEVCDVDSGTPQGEGGRGNLVVSCLYKDDIYPIIRFNTNDVTELMTGQGALGLNLRRIAGFLGRSDNMVKIRGINIYPQALAPILEQNSAYAGEFLCVATRDAAGRDDLTVRIEVREAASAGLAEAFKSLLREKLGVEVVIDLVAPGTLAPLTGIETRQKPIRLIDRRFT